MNERLSLYESNTFNSLIRCKSNIFGGSLALNQAPNHLIHLEKFWRPNNRNIGLRQPACLWIITNLEIQPDERRVIGWFIIFHALSANSIIAEEVPAIHRYLSVPPSRQSRDFQDYNVLPLYRKDLHLPSREMDKQNRLYCISTLSGRSDSKFTAGRRVKSDKGEPAYYVRLHGVTQRCAVIRIKDSSGTSPKSYLETPGDLAGSTLH